MVHVKLRSLLAGTSLSMTLLVASLAHAGPGEEAEALIAQGLTLREQGKDDQALEVFRRAEQKQKTPRATAQVALAEQALGMWGLAETHLAAALADKSDPWITKNRSALEGALATIQKHVGAVEIRANVPGQVFVDGAPVGTLPREAPLRLEVGPRQVEVRADGYYPMSHTVVVSNDTMARETFALVKLPAAPPSDSGAAQKPVTPVKPAPADGPNVPRTVGWVLVGTGVGAAVFGGVSFLVREVQTGRYNDRVDCPGINKPNQPAACQEILDAESTWRTVGIASFIGAGVLGAAGLTLVIASPNRPKTTALTASCGPFGAAPGVACVGTF